MAEVFEFGPAGAEDLEIGYGTFAVDLPDGTSDTFNKINLSQFLAAYTVTYSATPAFNLVNGQVQTITLTGNVTSSTITNGGDTVPTNAVLILRIIQDGTGGRTFAWPSNVLGASAAMVSGILSRTTVATLLFNGTNWEFAAPPLNVISSGVLGQTRVRSVGGTVLVAGDFALSAGWGSTASVGTITGTDQRFAVTVTSAGTGQGASPTITITFKDGTWNTIPMAVVVRNGGSQLTIFPTWTVTATTLVITFPLTPSAAQTFPLQVMILG